MPESGIKIDGKHYEIPSSLRVGETRMIKRLTGLNPPEFMVALGDLHKTQDPDVGAAMVWWIVHREDPSFTIEQVDDLEWGAIEGEGTPEEIVNPKDVAPSSASVNGTIDSSGSSAGISSSISETPSTQDGAGVSTHTSGGVQGLALSGQQT